MTISKQQKQDIQHYTEAYHAHVAAAEELLYLPIDGKTERLYKQHILMAEASKKKALDLIG